MINADLDNEVAGSSSYHEYSEQDSQGSISLHAHARTNNLPLYKHCLPLVSTSLPGF